MLTWNEMRDRVVDTHTAPPNHSLLKPPASNFYSNDISN